MPTSSNATVLYFQNESHCDFDTMQIIEQNSFTVHATTCFETSCEIFSHHKIDIILIDLGLNSQDGLKFIHYLREKNILTPVILTTDDIHSVPFIEAINLEISNCLIQPYEVKDLLHALKKAMAKVKICHPLSFTDLNLGFSYDPINKSIISSNGETIKLSNKEALLIELLLQNMEQITSYQMIETIVWQDSLMSIDALRTLIRGIRKKTYPDIIINHNNIGYKIDL